MLKSLLFAYEVKYFNQEQKKIACFNPKFSEWLPNIIRNKWLYSSFESSTDTGGGQRERAWFPGSFLGEIADKTTAKKHKKTLQRMEGLGRGTEGHARGGQGPCVPPVPAAW